MTRHTPSMGLDEQRDLQRKIADLLVVRAPADREQIRVMFRAAGNHVEMVGHILGIDGQLREWDAPPEAVEFFQRLRAGMYAEGAGTWSSASLIVEYPIRTTVNFTFKEDPRWRQPPPRTAVLDDLEMFPRTADNVPGWMKTVLPDAARVAEVAWRFRHARIFDHRDAAGKPVVNRPPVPDGERAGVLEYLNTAHVVMGGRGFDPDVFDPSGAADVPAAFHTDGTWIWPASLPHYLAKHGVPPEPDLVAHIRANGFTPPQLDQPTKDAAYTALTGEVPAPRPTPTAPDQTGARQDPAAQQPGAQQGQTTHQAGGQQDQTGAHQAGAQQAQPAHQTGAHQDQTAQQAGGHQTGGQQGQAAQQAGGQQDQNAQAGGQHTGEQQGQPAHQTGAQQNQTAHQAGGQQTGTQQTGGQQTQAAHQTGAQQGQAAQQTGGQQDQNAQAGGQHTGEQQDQAARTGGQTQAAHQALAASRQGAGAQQASAQATVPGELSDRDRRVLAIIERRVSEAGALPAAYRILGSAEGAVCLERVGEQWQVADYERGKPRDAQRFDQLWNAGAYLLGTLTITPSSLRAGGGDRNTAHALNDWPVQPLPGEPPLTLLADKHLAVLMPDREIVRFGLPVGNLTFADGTEFSAMSLRAEREQLGPRRYRVVRELRTLSGRTVPWHNQPGGGTAYLLPKSVEEHLADGSLSEV